MKKKKKNEKIDAVRNKYINYYTFLVASHYMVFKT